MYQSILDKYSSPPVAEIPGSAVNSGFPQEHEDQDHALEYQPDELRSWKDSRAIMALSEYLRENKSQGISLVLLDNRPALHFNPGLDPFDTDRISYMHKAWDLLAEALPDIEALLQSGARIMPDHPGFN